MGAQAKEQQTYTHRLFTQLNKNESTRRRRNIYDEHATIRHIYHCIPIMQRNKYLTGDADALTHRDHLPLAPISLISIVNRLCYLNEIFIYRFLFDVRDESTYLVVLLRLSVLIVFGVRLGVRRWQWTSNELTR